MIARLQRSWSYSCDEHGATLSSMIVRSKFRIRGQGARLSVFLDHLAEGINEEMTTPEKLAANFSLSCANIEIIWHQLLNRGAIVYQPNTSPSLPEAFARQELFFDKFERNGRSGASIQETLMKSTVVIIGIGGYGTWLAAILARCGIGRIILVDYDRVERTNLNRQILFDEQDIGRLKVEVAAEKLAAIDPAIKIEARVRRLHCIGDVRKEIVGADLAFNPFGYGDGPLVLGLTQACIDESIPLMTFSGSWIGPLSIPGTSCCLKCARAAIIKTDGIREMINEHDTPQRAAHVATFAPRIAMSASVAAWEAVRYLGQLDHTRTLDGIIVLDTFSYVTHGFINIEPDANCHCMKQTS